MHMMESKWNKWCHTASSVLWALSLLAFVLALTALAKQAGGVRPPLGMDALTWYINSFVLSVLGLGARGCKEDGCCAMRGPDNS